MLFRAVDRSAYFSCILYFGAYSLQEIRFFAGVGDLDSYFGADINISLALRLQHREGLMEDLLSTGG